MDDNQLITMTKKEARRYEVIKDLLAKKIDGSEAAKQLNLSVRQIKRIKVRVRQLKMKGVIHGNRGKASNRQTDKVIVKKAKKLLHEKYSDFNPLLAQEHLRDDDQISKSKETVRQWMMAEKLWQPKKKSRAMKFSWRERKDNYGEMEQFDGSYHDWFESRNPVEVGEEQCLLLAVDDATGAITAARFADNEGVKPVFGFWQEYFEATGLPLAIYLDKFSTYKVNHKNAVDNAELMTQFERAMKQLGVRVIHANTPQAKGRVEKMNGTLQRRLVKELRLAKISSLPEANRFLREIFIPKFNAQFSVVPKKPNDLHRQLSERQKNELVKILSLQSTRLVNNDYTVRFKSNYYQLQEIQPTTVVKQDLVTIEERLNGELKISLRGRYLGYRRLPDRPKKEIDIKLIALTRTKPAWIPPANHPWRNQIFTKQKQPILTAV